MARDRNGKEASTADRRHKAMQLRISGASYRAIAEALDVSLGQAFNDVKQELEELAAVTRMTTEQYRDQELARTDVALLGLAKAVKRGDERAVGSWTRVIELRCRLLGLYKDRPALETLLGLLPDELARPLRQALVQYLAGGGESGGGSGG